MAAVALVPITTDRSGAIATPAGVAANTGTPFTFPNSGNQVLRLKWTAADASAVIAIPGLVDGDAVAGKTISLAAASGDVLVGPFPVAVYGSTVSLTGPALATTLLSVIQFVPNQ